MIKKLIAITLIFMTALTASNIGILYLMFCALDKRGVVAAETEKACKKALNDTGDTDKSLDRTIVVGFKI